MPQAAVTPKRAWYARAAQQHAPTDPGLALLALRPLSVSLGRLSCGWPLGGRISHMSSDEIEAEALKLDPQARARLAKKLLESLETLSDEENECLWAEEADWRDADWDSAPGDARPAAEVLREARAKLK